LLNGFPLIAYTIVSAQKSNLFSEIIVSTDSEEIANIAVQWGSSVPMLRPKEFSTDSSTDIEWVMHCINKMASIPISEIEYISILRPTSPLRSAQSIVEAMEKLMKCSWADSIRAMEPAKQHPGKMWSLDSSNHASPFLKQIEAEVPTYNRPTQTLQRLWIQNASLEIVKTKSLIASKKISGEKVLGLELPGFEGHDINTKNDWDFLEYLISKYPNQFPQLIAPFSE
jgi:N-acylneuraminate cytidylyltransferase